MPIILKRLLQTKNILILIALLLAAEVILRITSTKPYEIEYPHFWETNFQYDRYFGWVGKSNFTVNLKPFGFENIAFDDRGFPVIPNITNDKIKNEKKILFIGSCDIYGGPMIGAEKGYINLLAKEDQGYLDFEAIGVSGYLLYQRYLLHKKFNNGGNDLVIVLFCPTFDFYLNTDFFMHKFGNRLVPCPQVVNDNITHNPVPYIKSYWEYKEPFDERFSLKEKVFLNCYCLSKIISLWIDKKSFDINLTKSIIKAFEVDAKNKGGKLALLIINLDLETPDPHLKVITDEFVTWLTQNDVGVIDVREKLIGHSLAKFGDPTHINSEGHEIIKNEIHSYVKKNGLVGD